MKDRPVEPRPFDCSIRARALSVLMGRKTRAVCPRAVTFRAAVCSSVLSRNVPRGTAIQCLVPTHVSASSGRVLVTGATGFIGRALVPGLCAAGYEVVAGSRRASASRAEWPGVEWRVCDLLRPETLPAALDGMKFAYYLVHSMGHGPSDYRERERRSARAFAEAAVRAGLERIVYLGGPAPRGRPSEHLRSRLEVGEILRAGAVPTLELRASMVIGAGGASWQIVRDLAMRLPFMVLPKWLESRTYPVALDDVVKALVSGLAVPLAGSEWFDLPGPEMLSGRQILERIAALGGHHVRSIEVPLLTPRLSALWLRLVTRTDFTLARELVLGFSEDLLPKDARYWQLIEGHRLLSFDDAAARALAAESDPFPWTEGIAWLKEMARRWKPKGPHDR